MIIRWTPAATALARQYMHDQDGMRTIGVAIAALAEDYARATLSARPDGNLDDQVAVRLIAR